MSELKYETREVDNFNQISGFMDFKNEGDFYYIQLIKRKAENPDMPKSQRLIKSYYVYNIEKYWDYEDEIKYLSYHTKSRAYIRLNVRNDKIIALQMLKRMAQRIADENYGFRKLYESICGEFHSAENKTWIIDIDEKDRVKNNIESINDVIEKINICRPAGNKVVTTIHTVSGRHIITHPFDMKDFKNKYPNIDVHKDNPTLLYCKFDKYVREI